MRAVVYSGFGVYFEPKKLFSLRSVHSACTKRQAGFSTVGPEMENAGLSEADYASARPFKSIPGPKPLPIPKVGNLWRLMPFGTYGKMDITDVQRRLLQEYGPIVKFTGLGNFDHVLLYDPKDVEKMFRNESIWPVRRPLFSMKYYRDVLQKDFYGDYEGLVTSNGEKWAEFRKTTNQVMLVPKNVKMYLNSVVDVCDDFIERVRYIRRENDEMPEEFIDEINKLSLETFTFMTLDMRLGCLRNDLAPDSETMMMIKNVRKVMTLLYELDFRPSLWRIFPTSDWRKFVKAMNYTVEFTNKHITEKWEKIKNQNDAENSGNKSILENLLLKTKNPRIPIIMASDTLFAAIDTTSTTMATTMYMLAKNPEKQEILFKELKKLLPSKTSPITEEIFNELKYTRAVIKESMRIQPTVPANQREAVKDLVIKNYQIPAGTALISSHFAMCSMDGHFKDPGTFLPERWLKSEGACEHSYKNVNPFVYLPFGFGNRSCIGKRFAYMEMDVVISKLIRNFKISYDGEPMTWTTRLVSSPSKPLNFKMTERHN